MIRYYVCLYIRQRARKCFGSSQAPSPAVVEAYVSRLCLDREWGDEIAVRAAGYLYERPVKVFISDGQGGIAVHPQFPGNIVNNNQNSNSSPGCITNEILLANYSGVTHFDALVTSCPVLWRDLCCSGTSTHTSSAHTNFPADQVHQVHVASLLLFSFPCLEQSPAVEYYDVQTC
jgi:hypothetical protein